MIFHLIFLLNIFSVSGFQISVNLNSDPYNKLNPKDGSDSKIFTKSAQPPIEQKDSEKCNFPIKSGLNKIQDFPENFDVRKVWPFCVSNFTSADLSTLHLSVDQMSDLICTTNGDRIDVQLTIDQMTRQTKDSKHQFDIQSDCDAYQFWSKNGLYSLDYQKTDICLPFSPQCKPSFITKDKYFKVNVTIPLNIPDKMRDLMIIGPAIALIETYDDFLGNNSGIYEKKSNERLGVYPFKIIGWGVENGIEYWLGMKIADDQGTFKIRRSEEKNGILKNWLSISLIEQSIRNQELTPEQSFYLAHQPDGTKYDNINGCLVVRNP